MELDLDRHKVSERRVRESIPGQPSRQEIGEVYGLLGALFDELSEEEQAEFGTLLFGETKPASMKIRALPAAEVLNQSELATLAAIEEVEVSQTRAQAGTMVLVMKGTRLCNLRCTYCHSWREGPGNVMSFTVLARSIRDALLAPGIKHVEFVWHGGEITLLGTKFLRNALWLQQRYLTDGVSVSNSAQTNAVDVSDEVMFFMRDHGISVGVSIDGPPALNDTRRVDKDGNGTSQRIFETLRRFKENEVPFGLLAVIDAEIAAIPPRDLLDFFVSTGTGAMDVLNVLPENDTDGCAVVGTYIPWPQYVEFMSNLFEIWWSDYKDRLDIRSLSSLVDKVANRGNSLCVFAGNCQGKYLTIEANGGISACDKYVGHKEYEYGSLFQGNLNEVLSNSPKLAAARLELSGYKAKSEPCEWYATCNGGCPHDRKLTHTHLQDQNGCCGLKPLLRKISDTISTPALAAE
ncbi:radical SAM protein [Devosia sp. Leaf64]|uniref:radical SAM/SPASM domain-containing protein n=1 Tax=Devosia sp. Leaf64 TaxID=1736229 RepID=UPI000714B002|nr:radical SAM protein [Devosia sp. Leaf64]KQN75050.1 hypothetical protein ASE94_01650 [Devosia sp. Leaf64]